jgi:hypothetical protein
MYEQVEKPKENKSRAVANSVAQKKSNIKQGFGFVDNRQLNTSQLLLNYKEADRIKSENVIPNRNEGAVGTVQRKVTVGKQEYTALELWDKLWADSHPGDLVWHDEYTEAVEKASADNKVFSNDIDLTMYLASFCMGMGKDNDYGSVDKEYGRRHSYERHTPGGIYGIRRVETAHPSMVAIFYSDSLFEKAIAGMPLKKSLWKQHAESRERYDTDAYGVHYQGELSKGVMHLRSCYPTSSRDQYNKDSVQRLLEMARSIREFSDWVCDFDEDYVQEKIRNYKTGFELWAESRKGKSGTK